MQNINLLSFVTHVLINIFFGFKKKLFGSRSLPFAITIKNRQTNVFLSSIIVVVIISLDVAQFDHTLRANITEHSGYRQLISLLENQNVFAQTSLFPYARTKDEPKPIEACQVSPNGQSRAYTKAVAIRTLNRVDSRNTIIKQYDNLWSAVKRLLMSYLDDNPCPELSKQDSAECQKMLDRLLGESAYRLLRDNGFTNGQKTPVVYPGQVVWLEISGKIRIDPPKIPVYIES